MGGKKTINFPRIVACTALTYTVESRWSRTCARVCALLAAEPTRRRPRGCLAALSRSGSHAMSERALSRLQRQLERHLSSGAAYEAREVGASLWARCPEASAAEAARTLSSAADQLLKAGHTAEAAGLAVVLATEGSTSAREAAAGELGALCEALVQAARRAGPGQAAFGTLSAAVDKCASARPGDERLRAYSAVLALEGDPACYAALVRGCARRGQWRVAVQATAFEIGRGGGQGAAEVELWACRAALLYLEAGGDAKHVDGMLHALAEMLQLSGSCAGADGAEAAPLVHFCRLMALTVRGKAAADNEVAARAADGCIATYAAALERDPRLLALARRIAGALRPQADAAGGPPPFAQMLSGLLGGLG